MTTSSFSPQDFLARDDDFRIGSVVADGMWYNLPKWRKLAKVSEKSINRWIEQHLADGSLVQATTGAKSYRFPLASVLKWHEENNIKLGTQLIEGFYPPRIWAGLTETEGFLATPRRELAIISFDCETPVANLITERLRGIARVREVTPGKYKAYCLHADYAKSIIEGAFREHPRRTSERIYSRAVNYRRELVDLEPEFSHHLILFYKAFAKTLTKRSWETINIFIPDPHDQENQLVVWVCEAVEKFDEREAAPFSGYLDICLRHWPYNLPNDHLGKELSNFQRGRSIAVKELKKKFPDKNEFSMQELADEMGADLATFVSLEEKHRVWLSSRASTTLTWDENSEEKMGRNFLASPEGGAPPVDNPRLAHRLSVAVLKAALDTAHYENAYSIIALIDNGSMNISKVKEVSEEFVQSLGDHLDL